MSDSDTGRRRSEKEIFFEALEKDTPQERAAFLDGACGPNPVQRARVEALLADHFAQDAFMREPAVVVSAPEQRTQAVPPAAPPAEAPSQMIGRYKLLEKIGEGGFGEVWMAEQREPVKRRVALKIIKLGMDSRQIVARFEAERQALARMDHPNIAKIFDAGTTGQESGGRGQEAEGAKAGSLLTPDSRLLPPAPGRPYFVMELVRGIKITDYCDQNHLSTRDRLKLFTLVCHAIQHAHQKGIIHRDLKPSNILVTLHDGVPVPKVIDFGIAKATHQELTDKTLFTQFQQFIGTPAYISPEQASTSGLDIDTRSDIYSLGVLLYELLVGRTPFDPAEMMKGGLDSLRQIIRQKEPVKPSTRLKTLSAPDQTATAQRRRTEPLKLSHQLRGDLDWIVLKCLEKDRTRRYDTANGLAADLQRHLANEPVIARPPSVAYRFQKAWQRNTLAFTAAAAVVLALMAGTGVSTWQAIRATRAERLAQQQFKEAATERDAKARAEIALEARNLDLRHAMYHADLLNVTTALNRHDDDSARISLDQCEPALRGWEWAYQDSRLPLAARIPLHDRRAGAGAGYLTRDATQMISLGVIGTNASLRFWNVRAGRKLREFPVLAWPNVLGVSPDERRAAVGTTNGLLCLYDLASGAALWQAPAHRTFVYGLAFHPAGTRLAACAADGAVTLWDTATGRLLGTNQGVGKLRTLAFSPDGRTLLVGGFSSGARLLDAATLQPLAVCDADGGGHPCVAFSPDGARFVTGGTDGFVRVWDTARRQVLVNCPVPHVKELPYAQKTVIVSNVSAVAFSPDGSRIASAGQDKAIRVWAASSGQLLDTFPTKVGAIGWLPFLQFSADGRQLLASGGGTGAAGRLWNLLHDHTTTLATGHSNRVWSAAFTPDSQRVITAGWDARLRLWQASDGRELGVFQGHRDRVLWSVAVTPDGRRAVSGSQDGTVRVWDLATGAAVGEAIPAQEPAGENSNNWTLHVAVSPDSRRVVSGGAQGQTQVCDLETRVRLWTLTNRFGRVWSIAWSPDGRKIAVGQAGGVVTMLDARQGHELWRQSSPAGSLTIIQSIAFAPDGLTFVTGGWAGELCLWDAADGRLKMQVEASPRPLRSVAFAPDGRRIASAGDDGGIRFWDMHALTQVFTLPPESCEVFCVAFSPDGKRLISGNAHGQVRIWQTEPLLPAVP